MKIRNTSIWDISTRIPEIYGILITLALIVFFFLMYLVGLAQIIELRLLNLAIVAVGVYFAMKQYRRTHGDYMDYFHAFTTGMATVGIGVLTFSAFLLIYLHIDNNFMDQLKEHPLGVYLNPYIAAFMVSVEGIFSGLFVTFLLSNYLAVRTPTSRGYRSRKPNTTPEVIH